MGEQASEPTFGTREYATRRRSVKNFVGVFFFPFSFFLLVIFEMVSLIVGMMGEL